MAMTDCQWHYYLKDKTLPGYYLWIGRVETDNPRPLPCLIMIAHIVASWSKESNCSAITDLFISMSLALVTDNISNTNPIWPILWWNMDCQDGRRTCTVHYCTTYPDIIVVWINHNFVFEVIFEEWEVDVISGRHYYCIRFTLTSICEFYNFTLNGLKLKFISFSKLWDLFWT